MHIFSAKQSWADGQIMNTGESNPLLTVIIKFSMCFFGVWPLCKAFCSLIIVHYLKLSFSFSLYIFVYLVYHIMHIFSAKKWGWWTNNEYGSFNPTADWYITPFYVSLQSMTNLYNILFIGCYSLPHITFLIYLFGRNDSLYLPSINFELLF